MNLRRDHRSSRVALLDSIEEGRIRPSSSFTALDIDDKANDKALDVLHDRVNILKKLSGEIHEEVDSHNRLLNRMGHNMDASRGVLSGTVDRFKLVFAMKSGRKSLKLVVCFVVVFLLFYYLTRLLSGRIG